MDSDQAETSDIGYVALGMASQSVIDAAAASLFADMETRITHPTTDPSFSGDADIWTTALASTIEGLRASLCSLIKTACEKRNSQQPIDRLPVELIITIFQLVVDSSTPDLRIRSVPTLALVARRWKEIVDLTPSLWATICDSYSSSTITTALIRSKHSPLAVHSAPYGVPGRQRMEEILQMVQPHIYRLQTVQIRFNDPRQIASLNAPAPKLRSLHLHLYRYLKRDSDRTGAPINVLAGSAESLEDLNLDGIQIPWESGMLKRLRSLCISRIKGPGSEITSSVIIRTLAQCPELEDLELVNIDLAMMNRQEDLTTVQASSLARVCISSLPYSFFRLFIALVTVPRITSINLGPPSTTPGDNATTHSLDSFRGKGMHESAPAVREVSIKGLAITWSPGAFKGLRLLNIDDITQGALTSKQLLVVIRENLLLESLRLWSIQVIPAVGGSPTPPVMTLSRLRKVGLYTIPFDFANTILSAILVPHLEVCQISMAPGSSPPSSIITIDPPSHNFQDHILLGPCIKRTFSRSPKVVVIVLSNGDVQLWSNEVPLAILITLRESGVSSTVALASQFLSALDSSHLPLELSFQNLDERRNFTALTLRHIVDMLPQTTAIDFCDDFDDLAPVFQLLATPKIGPDESRGSWPLPLLSSIDAMSTISFPDTLTMVQGRAGVHLTGQEKGVELPAPFESITFENQEEELIAEELKAIEAVVAPGVFHWSCHD